MPAAVRHGMDELAEQLARPHSRSAMSEVDRHRQEPASTFDQVAIDKATEYAAEDADVTLRLWQRAEAAAGRRAHDHGLRDAGAAAGAGAGAHGAARHLDRPAGAVAAVRRVRADARRGSKPRSSELAGEPINPGSPKQLGDILFGKMGLPGGTKTKTGAWSTARAVLEELAEQGHELPQKILDWRQVSKLNSTYTDALPGYVNPETHRVHTTYALAATTTGRLSSIRAEPAEHPGPHRGRPQDPPRLHRRRRATSWSPPTIRRSSCGCSPRSPTSRR